MNPTDLVCLKWNFQENTSTSFRGLRENPNFSDVTLACEDREEINAHKLILSASSAFFDNLLIRNPHAHPIIYMRGVTSDELTKIVDFIYFGEVNIFQENLTSFLRIAEELKIKGLMGGLETSDGEKKFDITKRDQTNAISRKETETLTQHIKKENENKSDTEKTVNPKISFSGHLQELDDKISSLVSMENLLLVDGRKIYTCIVCGKEGKISNIKQHIEAAHIDGISAPCKMCKKTYRSRAVLNKHITRKHGKTFKVAPTSKKVSQIEELWNSGLIMSDPIVPKISVLQHTI